MFDYAYLHRHDFKLLADLLANGERLAFASALGGSDDLFFCIFVGNVSDVFCVIEKGKLGRSRISCLLGLAPEQALTQQRVFLFKKTDPRLHLRKHLLEKLKVVREVFGHRIHAVDYTESGHESRRQNLMRTVTPEVKTVEHPVEFLDSQDHRFVRHVGRRFEAFGLQAFEPKAETVVLSVQDLHAVAWLVEEDKKHWGEDCDLDIQLDQRRQAVNGFSEVDGLGVQIHFSTLHRDASWLAGS